MHSELYGSRELRPGEVVETRVHRSPWVSLGRIAAASVLVVGDSFLLSWWFAHGAWGALGFLAVLVLGALAAVAAYVGWRNSLLVVTNQRVLVVHQLGLLTRTEAEVPLNRILDVRFTVQGLRANLLRYGTVHLEVMGAGKPVELPGVPKPERIQELLGRLREQVSPPAPPAAPTAPPNTPAAPRPARSRVDGVSRGV